jgi:hypothetical protein
VDPDGSTLSRLWEGVKSDFDEFGSLIALPFGAVGAIWERRKGKIDPAKLSESERAAYSIWNAITESWEQDEFASDFVGLLKDMAVESLPGKAVEALIEGDPDILIDKVLTDPLWTMADIALLKGMGQLAVGKPMQMAAKNKEAYIRASQIVDHSFVRQGASKIAREVPMIERGLSKLGLAGEGARARQVRGQLYSDKVAKDAALAYELHANILKPARDAGIATSKREAAKIAKNTGVDPRDVPTLSDYYMYGLKADPNPMQKALGLMRMPDEAIPIVKRTRVLFDEVADAYGLNQGNVKFRLIDHDGNLKYAIKDGVEAKNRIKGSLYDEARETVELPWTVAEQRRYQPIAVELNSAGIDIGQIFDVSAKGKSLAYYDLNEVKRLAAGGAPKELAKNRRWAKYEDGYIDLSKVEDAALANWKKTGARFQEAVQNMEPKRALALMQGELDEAASIYRQAMNLTKADDAVILFNKLHGIKDFKLDFTDFIKPEKELASMADWMIDRGIMHHYSPSAVNLLDEHASTVAKGIYDPVYYPMLAEPTSLRDLAGEVLGRLRGAPSEAARRRAAGFLPLQRHPMTGAPQIQLPGYMRKSRGVRLSTGEYNRNVEEALRSTLREYTKHQHTIQTTKVLSTLEEDGGWARPYAAGTSVPDGYKVYSPDGVTHMAKSRAKIADELTRMIDDDLDGTLRLMHENPELFLKQMQGVLDEVPKGDWAHRKVIVPEEVLDAFVQKGMTGVGKKWESFGRLVLDPISKAFRTSVLGLNPGWLVGDVVGNTLLAALAGEDVWIKSIMRKLKGTKLGMAPEEYLAVGARNLDEALAKGQLVIPTELGAGHITFETAVAGRHMGAVGDTAAGRIIQATQKAVWNRANPLKIISDTVYRLNKKYAEDMVRQQHYASKLIKYAKDDMRRNGIFTNNVEEILKHAQKGYKPGEILSMPAPMRKALDSVETWHGAYTRMSPVERRVLRRLSPFYAWHLHINKLKLTMPFRYPGRTALIGTLSQFAEDMRRDELKDMIQYRGAAQVGGTEERGLFLRTERYDPLHETLLRESLGEGVKFAVSKHPLIDIWESQIGGRDPFTGRKYEKGESPSALWDSARRILPILKDANDIARHLSGKVVGREISSSTPWDYRPALDTKRYDALNKMRLPAAGAKWMNDKEKLAYSQAHAQYTAALRRGEDVESAIDIGFNSLEAKDRARLIGSTVKGAHKTLFQTIVQKLGVSLTDRDIIGEIQKNIDREKRELSRREKREMRYQTMRRRME